MHEEKLWSKHTLSFPPLVPAPTHILYADGQLCLKVTKILGQLITMVIESEESLQEGQELSRGKKGRGHTGQLRRENVARSEFPALSVWQA